MKLVVILFVCSFVALANIALATEHHHAKSGEVAGGHEEKGKMKTIYVNFEDILQINTNRCKIQRVQACQKEWQVV
jgi:hypothetical protein